MWSSRNCMSLLFPPTKIYMTLYYRKINETTQRERIKCSSNLLSSSFSPLRTLIMRFFAFSSVQSSRKITLKMQISQPEHISLSWKEAQHMCFYISSTDFFIQPPHLYIYFSLFAYYKVAFCLTDNEWLGFALLSSQFV